MALSHSRVTFSQHCRDRVAYYVAPAQDNRASTLERHARGFQQSDDSGRSARRKCWYRTTRRKKANVVSIKSEFKGYLVREV